MKDGCRINPAAQPNAQRHIRNQMLANGILHQRIEIFFGGFQRVRVRNSERQGPVRPYRNLAVLPLEPISRRKFLNAIHESPWDRNVVQRKVAIEARQTEPTVNLGMDKEGLQLRAEEQIVILARNVKWFDPHAVT